MGRDASFYKLFEKMFDLKTHSKFDYLMFNDKFKANFKNYDKKGDLKQEAYILDWVDRIIDNNPILKYYKSYFAAELQGIIENINCIEPKRYDGVLHKAHIILENDEDHNDDVLENDSYKNSDAILSGYAMLRINSSKILDYVTEKTKNDKYIKECRQMIIDLFLGSLMDKQEARSHMLQLKFQEIIVDDIKDLCIKITQVKLQLEDEKNNTIILNGLKNELKSKRKLLEDFNNKDTMELFELKHKTHGDQTNKVINFEICCSLLKVVNEEDKNALKLYIICKNLGDNKNNISWEVFLYFFVNPVSGNVQKDSNLFSFILESIFSIYFFITSSLCSLDAFNNLEPPFFFHPAPVLRDIF